jgi:predicted DNA-binding transcriptional regulator AlpA
MLDSKSIVASTEQRTKGRRAVVDVSRSELPELLTKPMILKQFLPCGHRTLFRWMASGVFPKPDISIGGKVRYWRKSTILAWIDAQCEATRGNA